MDLYRIVMGTAIFGLIASLPYVCSETDREEEERKAEIAEQLVTDTGTVHDPQFIDTGMYDTAGICFTFNGWNTTGKFCQQRVWGRDWDFQFDPVTNERIEEAIRANHGRQVLLTFDGSQTGATRTFYKIEFPDGISFDTGIVGKYVEGKVE